MALDQLKAFLTELQKNQALLNAIRVAATANEIAEIASGFGYQFSGDELKAASKENIAGVKIKKQDTSPSYSFGESGIDPNEKNYKSGNLWELPYRHIRLTATVIRNGFAMTCFFSTFIHALVRICFELRYGGMLGTDRTMSRAIKLLVE